MDSKHSDSDIDDHTDAVRISKYSQYLLNGWELWAKIHFMLDDYQRVNIKFETNLRDINVTLHY